MSVRLFKIHNTSSSFHNVICRPAHQQYSYPGIFLLRHMPQKKQRHHLRYFLWFNPCRQLSTTEPTAQSPTMRWGRVGRVKVRRLMGRDDTV